MKTFLPSKKTTIFADIIIIALCMLGVYNIASKSGLPFKIQHNNSRLVVNMPESQSASIKKGDIILRIDEHVVETSEEIELLLDGKNIGESLKAEIQRGDQLLDVEFITVNYYSTFYIGVAVLVGLMFIVVGILIFLKCNILETATALHWALILTAMIILMTWGNFLKPNPVFGFLTRAGFHLGYVLAPVFFLKFVTIFPSRTNLNTTKLFQSLAFIAAILFIALNYTFFLYATTIELVQMRAYRIVFDISSIFIVIISLSAILLFIQSYRLSIIENERKKIRWILLGFILGPLSYFVLWVIPSRLWNNPILPEPAVLLLVAFVPITFGIAIIKYRILNIDIIFKRGLVYFSAISFLLIIYLSILSLLATLLNNPNSELSSILAAISIALLFQPLKTKVRSLVDKKFFRVEYDYRQSLNSFLTEIKGFYSVDTIIRRGIEFINEVIPTNSIGFLNYSNQGFELLYGINFDLDENFNVEHYREIIDGNYSLVIAKQDDVEHEAKTNILPDKFAEINVNLVFVIKSNKNDPHGILAIGSKKSKFKFTIEDIDLLTVITTRLSIMLDRVKLQEEVVREQLEKERLEELNKLKSYFVSSVSHDLKTPLTSIKMFAEILKTTDNISPQKAKEYLDIIEGESNRLTRLIDNVLDYSKIEKGIKKYSFMTVEINKVVGEILKMMEYQFEINAFTVETDLYPSELFICADRDAIVEAIINIISNSIKFSVDKKSLIISTSKNNSIVCITITDKGAGIPKDEVDKIFEPFFQSKKISVELNSGAGLGLSIVKHIVDAHRGKIKINSKVNEGTTIALEFPAKESYD